MSAGKRKFTVPDDPRPYSKLYRPRNKPGGVNSGSKKRTLARKLRRKTINAVHTWRDDYICLHVDVMEPPKHKIIHVLRSPGSLMNQKSELLLLSNSESKKFALQVDAVKDVRTCTSTHVNVLKKGYLFYTGPPDLRDEEQIVLLQRFNYVKRTKREIENSRIVDAFKNF